MAVILRVAGGFLELVGPDGVVVRRELTGRLCRRWPVSGRATVLIGVE